MSAVRCLACKPALPDALLQRALLASLAVHLAAGLYLAPRWQEVTAVQASVMQATLQGPSASAPRSPPAPSAAVPAQPHAPRKPGPQLLVRADPAANASPNWAVPTVQATAAATANSTAGGMGQAQGEATTPPEFGAAYLNNPPPEYPPLARRRRLQGTPLLLVHVNARGRPAAVALRQSSGSEILDQAALEAVRGWSFVPAKRGSEAIAGSVLVPVQFRLDD